MKLTLKNFQSISNADVEIGPLTVLVGQSDVGKSAVIRALYLLHRNQGGLELVKHGKSALEVTQHLDSGLRVSILKGKGINKYLSGESTFSKVGRDVPPEVSRNLRTEELVLDKDQTLDLNFCRQFDSPFLLSDSTTVITKAVSSLSGINIIYAAIREGTSEYQKSKVKAEVLQSSIGDLLKYEALSKEVDSLAESLREIKELQAEIEKCKKTVLDYKTILAALEDLQKREVNLSSFEFLMLSLQDTWKEQQDLKSKKTLHETALARVSGISKYALSEELSKDVETLGTSLSGLGKSFDELSQARKDVSGYKDLSARLLDIQSKQLDTESQLTSCQQQILELESQVKICPTCQRPL